MKKILLSLACAGLLASSAAAERVDARALRSYGDTAASGFAWAIGAQSFDTVCEDAGLGAVTIQGAAYAGGIGQVGLGLPAADDRIQQMGAMALFDAAELAAAGSSYDLVLEASDNLGISFQLHVGLVDERSMRQVFGGTGPFAGSFVTYHTGGMGSNANDGITTLGGATGQTRFPDTVVPEIRISLGSGGGMLSGCLNGSGQLRILDPENNANWREECEANGWRPVQVNIGGGLDLSAAIGRDPIATCSYSCAGPTRPCVAADGTLGTPDLVVENPIALSITAAGEQTDRWGSFVSNTGFLGALNLLVLGGDPTEPSDLYIDAN